MGFYTGLILFLIAFFIPSIIRGMVPQTIAFIVLLFSTIVLIGFTIHIIRLLRLGKRLDTFAKSIVVLGFKLIFSNPLTLEPGRVTSVGYWIGITRRRGYYHETRFVPVGKFLVQGDLDFTKISSGYKVLVALDGAGVVEVPVFKIRDPEFENFFILVFNSSGLEIELKSASTSDEYSRVGIKVIKDGLRINCDKIYGYTF